MIDKFNIDGHKLIYHPERTNDWLKHKNIPPIYAEISPIGSCNHRCTFCGLDFTGYQNHKLDTELLKERLTELSINGLKSVMYAGEGEPLLHPDIAHIITHTKISGIDVALTTNGVKLYPTLSKKILPYMSWIKVSINAGTEETYSKIHNCQPSDFQKVVDNMEYAAKVKKENNLNVTLGMQTLLLPENATEITYLAQIAKEIGMDYLVVKPYSQHLMSSNEKYKNIKYEDYSKLKTFLERFNTDTFNVIFRENTMENWDNKNHSYKKCYSLPFWSYIDAEGNVWGCSCFLGDEKFLYGNINDETFMQIWNGEKRKESLKYTSNLDISQCRVNCRMNKVNEYLWNLKNPVEHVNFI